MLEKAREFEARSHGQDLRLDRILLLERFETLAGSRHQRLTIQDIDDASRITDGARLLKFSRDLRHGRPADAQHFRKKLLGEVYGQAVRYNACLKQPSAEALFDPMERVAGGGVRACANRVSLYFRHMIWRALLVSPCRLIVDAGMTAAVI